MSNKVFWFEVYTFAALAAFFFIHRFGPSFYRLTKLEAHRTSSLLAFALRRLFSPIILLGLLAFVSSAAVSYFVHWPEPWFHDEFSYLLAGDTFAHGRLANPSHPLWRFFESPHTFHQPAYASKYPPAQGMALALGQVLTGHPIAGVWLTFALACMGIYWMLSAWLPARWAAVGALLAMLRMGFLGQPLPFMQFGYWSQSFWGGAVTALGGALLFGSLRRIVTAPGAGLAWLMGLGLLFLAQSRPYEGLLAALPAAGVLALWFRRQKGPDFRKALLSVALPLALSSAAIVFSITYYNWRVTGDALKMPYKHHEEIYSMPPLFLGQKHTPPPPLRHSSLNSYYRDFVHTIYDGHNDLRGFVELTKQKAQTLWAFFLGPLLTVPLLMLPWIWRDRWMRFAFLCMGISLLGAIPIERYMVPHYGAPVACLLFAAVAQGLRHLRLLRIKGKPYGPFLLNLIVFLCILSLWVPFRHRMGGRDAAWDQPGARARILDELQRNKTRDLVFVRYNKDHFFHFEWVYNGADIDGSDVVWAHDMGDEENVQLVRHLGGRRLWLVEADGPVPDPVPYEIGAPAPEEKPS